MILKSKNKSYHHKRPILIDNIDANNIVVSNMNGFKYFIGYKDAKKLDLHSYFFQNWVHLE